MSRKILMVLCSLVVLLFASCSSESGVELADVSITISGFAKGIEPGISLETAGYKLYVYKDGVQDPVAKKEDIGSSTASVDLTLPAGTYRFVVDAFNEDGTVIGSGNAEEAIAAGKTNTVEIHVVETKGTGTFSISISSDSPYTFTSVIKDVADVEKETMDLELADGRYTASHTLENGFYTFEIVVKETGKTIKRDSVRIVAGDSVSYSASVSFLGDIAVTIENEILPTPVVSIAMDKESYTTADSLVAEVVTGSFGSGAVYRWYLDNNPLEPSSSSIRLDLSAIASGSHELKVIISEGPVVWSASADVVVVPSTYTVPVPGMTSGPTSKSLNLSSIDPNSVGLVPEFSAFTDRNGTDVNEAMAKYKLYAGMLRTVPVVPVLKPFEMSASKHELPEDFPEEIVNYGIRVRLEKWDNKSTGFYFFYKLYASDSQDPIGVIHYYYDLKTNRFTYRQFTSYSLGPMGVGIISISMDDVAVDPETGDYIVGEYKDGEYNYNAYAEMISLSDQMNDYRDNSGTRGCQIYSRFYFTAKSADDMYFSLFIPRNYASYSPKSPTSRWVSSDYENSLAAANAWVDFEEGTSLNMTYEVMEKVVESVWGKNYGVDSPMTFNKNFINHEMPVPSVFTNELKEDWWELKYAHTNPVIYNFKEGIGAGALIGGGQELLDNMVYSSNPAELIYRNMGFEHFIGNFDSELQSLTDNGEKATFLSREIYSYILKECGYTPSQITDLMETYLTFGE